MFQYLFSASKKSKQQDAKEAVLKGFFNFSSQKKAITRAAKESAKDQQRMVEKYDKLVKVRQ